MGYEAEISAVRGKRVKLTMETGTTETQATTYSENPQVIETLRHTFK